MLTGTPLDLTPFGPLFTAMGLLYWALAAGTAVLAWRVPKRRGFKLLLVVLVIAAFLLPMVTRRIEQGQYHSRLSESLTLFKERCTRAGEKVVRTVKNVEGVVWMRWREKYSNSDNFADQFKLNDPYGRDCGLEDCIAALLRVSEGINLNANEAARYHKGFRFVETVDPRDGLTYRYRRVIKSVHTRTPQELEAYKRNSGRDPGLDVYGPALERDRIPALTLHFGVQWDDISTGEEREHWIAGGSLTVIDLAANDVLGERIGYMLDRGQGSQAGFRSPWLFAEQDSCPQFPRIGESDSRRRRAGSETRDFVTLILNPTEE